MVEITSETPRDTITIAGETFSVPQPYAAGSVLTAGEASALNQTYAENVRNNQASKIKAAQADGTFNHDVAQGAVDDYCAGYEFGVRTGGGRTGDPVMQEAMDIARGLVREAVVKAGHKLADVPAKKISELAAGVIAKADAQADQIMTLARQKVESQKSLSGLDLSGLNLETAPATEAGAETATNGKKAKVPAEAEG